MYAGVPMIAPLAVRSVPAAVAIDGRGLDLNDSLGNLAGFTVDGERLFRVLDERRGALRRLVADGGTVLGAINERYGIPAGVIYGYPVTCRNGDYQIVQGLAINDFSRQRMDVTHKELLEERDGVKELI